MIELFNNSLENPAGATALILYKVKDVMRYPKWGIDQNVLLGSFTPDRLLVVTQGFKLNVIQDSISFDEPQTIDVQGEVITQTLTCRVQGDDYLVRADIKRLGTGRFVAQWKERQNPVHPDVGQLWKMAGSPEQGMELNWRYVMAAAAGGQHIYELKLKCISNKPASYTLLAMVD